MNIKKAASAIHQNQKQIKAALSGAELTFAAVEKSLGRAQFLLKLPKHKTATGTPRGLFTCGTMRISPGQIVIIEGNEKTGFEIVGRIEDLSIAKKLVKNGTMSAEVLSAATTCGTLPTITSSSPEDDDFFDYSQAQKGEDELSSKGGAAGQRRQRESIAAAHALATRLGSIDEDGVEI